MEHKIDSELYRKGLKEVERKEVRKVFMGDYDTTSVHPDEHGISRDEADQRIKWLKENPNDHILSPDKVKALEEVIDRHLPKPIPEGEATGQEPQK